jgi:hypothetical protein
MKPGQLGQALALAGVGHGAFVFGFTMIMLSVAAVLWSILGQV